MNRIVGMILSAIFVCLMFSALVFAEEPASGEGKTKTSKADRRGEEGFRALYTIGRDGSNVRFLTAAPGMISSATPEWSHDGKQVAFDAVPVLDEVTQSRIFVADIDGSRRGEIRDLGYGNVPSWSPDDRQIAFMLNVGNPEGDGDGIWIMNADGTGRRRLYSGWYPRWSPDGREICIYDYAQPSPQLLFYEVKTERIRRILGGEIPVEFGGGTWSPDGKRVVFIGTMENRRHVMVIDAGGKLETLGILYTENDLKRGLVGPPSWSPDGKDVVFAIQDLDQADGRVRRWHHTYLYTISAETPGDAKLLEPKKIGLINRGMMWAPDGRKIVFSSER